MEELTETGINDRLEDLYPVVIRRFQNTEEFFKFAQSKYGLKLSLANINTIREDYPNNSYGQKQAALEMWKMCNGIEATSGNLRKAEDTYFANYPQHDSTVDDATPAMLAASPSGVGTSEGNQIINITNINGPIQGPAFLGNEKMTYAAGGGGSGTFFPSTPFNDGVPPLKPSATEITKDDGMITVGRATLKYSQSTVTETEKILLTYEVDLSETPKDCIRASSMLTCSPTLSSPRRQMEVCLPTFCSTKHSVAASIYKKVEEGQWKQVTEAILANDRQIFVSVNEISNMAAFIPKERMNDVVYSTACFLFNDADGQIIRGFCLDDEAIKAAFCHRIKRNGFGETTHIPDVLRTRLGDEIAFKISPGQVMPTPNLIIDENFLCGVEGFTSRFTLDKDAVNPQYYISHYRNGKEIDDYVYGINSEQESEIQGGVPGIQFIGQAEIGNFISKVKYAEIDQRKYRDNSGTTKEIDKVRYSENEECSEGKASKCKENSECKANLGFKGTRPRSIGGITFHGKSKIGNIVHNAQHVKIDQRTIPQQTKPAEIERIVPAQQPEQEDEKTSVKEISTAIAASGDVKVQAKPITLDCEKKAEEGSTVQGSGNLEDEALPIWNDCEKQAAEDRARREAEMNATKETSSHQYHGQPSGKNKAEPTPNTESSEDSGSEMLSSGFSSGIKEVDLKKGEKRIRRRKEKQSTEKPRIKAIVVPSNGSSKEPEKKGFVESLDMAHRAMLAIIAVLLLVMAVLMQESGLS